MDSEKKRKKAEAKEAKAAAIAANGGERPRKKDKKNGPQNDGGKKSLNASGKNARSNSAGTKVKTTVFKRGGGVDRTGTQKVFEPTVTGGDGAGGGGSGVSGKFGRVMSKVRFFLGLGLGLGLCDGDSEELTATRVPCPQWLQCLTQSSTSPQLPSISCPRYDTLSIAVPTSIVANAQSKELKTMLCGQIARAATIYCVDEIVIYEDVEVR